MKSSQKITQADLILKAFKESGNKLTPSDILRLGIAQYNARIKELRDKGYRIESEYLGTFNGVKHTQFTLKSEPRKYIPPPPKKPEHFPSKIHQTAHEISLQKEIKTDQLTLI